MVYTTKLKYSLELLNKSRKFKNIQNDEQSLFVTQTKANLQNGLADEKSDIQLDDIKEIVTTGMVDSLNLGLVNLEKKEKFVNPNRDYSFFVSDSFLLEI